MNRVPRAQPEGEVYLRRHNSLTPVDKCYIFRAAVRVAIGALQQEFDWSPP